MEEQKTGNGRRQLDIDVGMRGSIDSLDSPHLQRSPSKIAYVR